MLILREDTVVTVQIGPFVDATDGATAEIALTIDQGDVHLSKNGGAFGNKNEATACTHDAEHNGWYTCPLDATDTNTAGVLILAVNEAGALPVWHEFMVMPTQVWDSLFSTDVLQVHAIEITNGLITAAAIADAAIDAATFAAGAINAAAIAADAIGASELAADAATEIAAAVWNSLVASYTTNVTFGKYLGGAPAGATLAADVVDLHTDVGTAITAIGDVHATDLPDIHTDVADLHTDLVTAITNIGDLHTDVGTVHTDVDAILADTNELQTDWVNAGRLDAILDLILADTAELQTDWVNAGRLDAILDLILADTAELQTDWVNGGRLDLLLDGATAPTAATVAAAVWNSLVASYTTNVTFGKYLGGAPAGATLAADVVDVHTDVGTVHTDVDAILADTNELQTDWVNAGRLDAILDLILADTAELQTDWVNGGRLDLLLDAVTPGITAAVVADAVWDELSTGHVTAGKAGTQLWTDIDAILAGPGGIKFVYTLTDSVTANPIADCLIWVTTDTAGTSRVTSARTDALGQVTFYLDAGTYYIWRQKSGYAFVNPDTEVVA